MLFFQDFKEDRSSQGFTQVEKTDWSNTFESKENHSEAKSYQTYIRWGCQSYWGKSFLFVT